MERKLWVVKNGEANWEIFENGTLIAVVHTSYKTAQRICDEHNVSLGY